MHNSNNRFNKVYNQNVGINRKLEIWVDIKTGVNYLFRLDGNRGGITVLLDKDGKPVVTPVESD